MLAGVRLMSRPPCEWRVRELIPIIRAAMARILVNERKYSIYQAAKVLGVTPAAVSNYLTSRRSRSSVVERILRDESIRTLIAKYVGKVVQGDVDIGEALCRLCRSLASNDVIRQELGGR